MAAYHLFENCDIPHGTRTWSIEKLKPKPPYKSRVGSAINHKVTLFPESGHSAPFVDEQEECEPIKVKSKYAI